MCAGMLPMALGLGEGGAMAAPLARAVIGGLIASTLATLLIVPAVFVWVQRAEVRSPLHLTRSADPTSLHYHPTRVSIMKPWPLVLLLVADRLPTSESRAASSRLCRRWRSFIQKPDHFRRWSNNRAGSKGSNRRRSSPSCQVMSRNGRPTLAMWSRQGQVLAELFIPETEEELKQKEASVGLAAAQVEEARKAFMQRRPTSRKPMPASRQAEASKTRAIANFTRWRTELADRRLSLEGRLHRANLISRPMLSEQPKQQ